MDFWTQQCPARGPGLMHTKSIEHHGCRDCSMVPPRSNTPHVAPVSPIDVSARLASLGITSGPTVPDLPTENDDDTIREPQMAAGWGENGEWLGSPRGAAHGRGRSWYGDGGLNPRDYAPLGRIIFEENRRGYR